MHKFVQILIEKLMYYAFDATTTYFETFSREGYKKPGYSKDGKFKEDQIVIGMATDENGIPLHYKIFLRKCYRFKLPFIPFYAWNCRYFMIVNSVTIDCWQRNVVLIEILAFLESKNWKYIISIIEWKLECKQFKEFMSLDCHKRLL